MAESKDPLWMEHATEKMKEKGTLGSFGKATPKKIAAGKAEGGAQAKKAVFAQNVAKSRKPETRKRGVKRG